MSNSPPSPPIINQPKSSMVKISESTLGPLRGEIEAWNVSAAPTRSEVGRSLLSDAQQIVKVVNAYRTWHSTTSKPRLVFREATRVYDDIKMALKGVVVSVNRCEKEAERILAYQTLQTCFGPGTFRGTLSSLAEPKSLVHERVMSEIEPVFTHFKTSKSFCLENFLRIQCAMISESIQLPLSDRFKTTLINALDACGLEDSKSLLSLELSELEKIRKCLTGVGLDSCKLFSPLKIQIEQREHNEQFKSKTDRVIYDLRFSSTPEKVMNQIEALHGFATRPLTPDSQAYLQGQFNHLMISDSFFKRVHLDQANVVKACEQLTALGLESSHIYEKLSQFKSQFEEGTYLLLKVKPSLDVSVRQLHSTPLKASTLLNCLDNIVITIRKSTLDRDHPLDLNLKRYLRESLSSLELEKSDAFKSLSIREREWVGQVLSYYDLTDLDLYAALNSKESASDKRARLDALLPLYKSRVITKPDVLIELITSLKERNLHLMLEQDRTTTCLGESVAGQELLYLRDVYTDLHKLNLEKDSPVSFDCRLYLHRELMILDNELTQIESKLKAGMSLISPGISKPIRKEKVHSRGLSVRFSIPDEPSTSK